MISVHFDFRTRANDQRILPGMTLGNKIKRTYLIRLSSPLPITYKYHKYLPDLVLLFASNIIVARIVTNQYSFLMELVMAKM